MKQHILMMGASGSGTTTIARGICQRTGYRHFDADDYFWLPTEDPYTVERDPAERLALMQKDLLSSTRWVLSGSLAGWGDALLPLFDLVVFVYVPPEIRIPRIQKREWERFGPRILPGGDRHQAYVEFVAWASSYETGARKGRSLPRHEAWLQRVVCPILRIGNEDLDQSIEAVIRAMEES